MVRHEYVDHVAALVAASAATFTETGALPDARDVAARALAVAEALADLRYPEPSAERAAGTECPHPPPGWRCSRTPGHDGPCACWPIKTGRP